MELALMVSFVSAVAYPVCVVLGAAAGYAFRGKINKGIKSVGSDVSSAASSVSKKV